MNNQRSILNLPNSLFSFASSHRFTTLMTPFPATRGISNVPPIRSIFCNTFRFNSPLSLFGVVFVISWPKFDAGGILTMIWIVSICWKRELNVIFCFFFFDALAALLDSRFSLNCWIEIVFFFYIFLFSTSFPERKWLYRNETVIVIHFTFLQFFFFFGNNFRLLLNFSFFYLSQQKK